MAMTKQFVKTQWNNDREPAITAEQLNRMEKGIDVNDTRIVELDKAVTANKTSGDKSLAEVNKTLQKHTEDITAVNNELTSQSKAIGELADKKITKFYASSQGESTLNDSDNGKMQDMMLYGKSEQKQYSGKNLLNLRLGKSGTGDGVTFTRNADGSYRMEGTATGISGNVWFLGGFYQQITDKNTLFILEPGMYVIKDCVLFSSTIKFVNTVTIETRTSITGVRNNYMNTGATYNTTVYPRVFAGDTDTGWEPYVGGIPSPNPDYPQEIKSVVNPTVKVTGKNLLKPILQTTTVNGVTCTNNGDGTYTLNGTATNVTVFEVTKMTNLKLKKVLGCPKGGNQDTYKLYVLDTENFSTGFDDIGNGVIVSANVNNDLEFSIRLRVAKDATVNNVVFKPMITTDTSATYDDFEPYREQSVTLTGVTLNAIPVSSGGNVTIDGQQYISDYVDVERGKIVRMVNNARLLSSYNWYTADKYYFGSVTGVTNSKEPIVADNSKKLCLCNYLVAASTYDIVNNVKKGIAINNLKQVIISLEKFASAEDLKTFLANNDVRLVYPLATHTEESLSDELAEKLKALQTYYPQTNLFITSNQLDGYAIFNYPISLANGWNYVKQQIGDTRDYIYDMDLQSSQAYVNSEYAVVLTELEV